MDSNEYIIKDIEQFTNTTRYLVFNNFNDKNKDIQDNLDTLLTELDIEQQKELDSILSYNESLSIVKKSIKCQRNKKNNNVRYILSDDIFLQIIESLNDRMISNLLNNLVNRGLIETAFDSQANDFIFWISDEVKEEIKKSKAD